MTSLDTSTAAAPARVGAPSGLDDLAVREAWLKRRRSSGMGSRGLIALWLAAGAFVCWIFVAAFAGLGH
jgi:hypothetical protein